MGTRDVALHPSSLNPPTNRGGPGADRANTRRPDWVLLDFSAHVLDRPDSTTATCKFRGDIELKVAFVVVPPPNVSYFYAYCHGLEPSNYAMEPRILATEEDLVLLRVIVGGRSGIWDTSAHEYFIYRAQGRPSLEQIPPPGPYLLHGGGDPVGLLKHNDGYIIASLGDDASAFQRRASRGQFEVCLFDSKDKVWTTRPVNLPPRSKVPFPHETSKVLTIGGRRGTMAFVDLWHGILLYDVLADDPLPRYIPLPETTTFGTPDYRDDAFNYRDIAVVKSHLKYVEMGSKATTDIPMVATYSIPVASCQEDTWHPDCVIDVSDIRDDKNLLSPEVQRMLKYDERMEPEPTMKTLCTGHPTLSLDDEDTVYFMTKFKPMSRKACVIAVNMRLGTIQEVARFGAARTSGINFTYIRSRISSYLNITPPVIRDAGLRKKTKGTKVGFGLSTPGF